ncbi:MAG: O-antigen ligase family protein [bacterium]
MEKERIIDLFEEISLLFLLITLPFIGIQSVRGFILPYNLLFFLGVFIFFALQAYSNNKKTGGFLTFGEALLFLFFSACFISFFFSKYPYGSKVEFSQITAYVCLAFALAGKGKDAPFQKMFWLLLALGFLESIYSIFQVFGIDVFIWSVNFRSRGFGTLVNPNHLAGYLVLIFPLSIYFFCSGGLNIIKSVSGIFLVFIVTGIVISSSQGGILAFGLSCASFLFFLIKKNILKTEDKIYLIIITFVIIILNISFYNFTRNKQETLPGRVSQIIEEGNPSVKGRLLNWYGTLRMIEAKPFLGWGPGTYKDVFIKYRPLEFNKLEPSEHPRLYAHNDFLQMISETGILSFCFFSLLIIVFFKNTTKILKENDPLFYLTLNCILIAGLAAGFFNTSFIFHYFIMPSASLFWMVLGLGLRENSSEGFSGLKIKRAVVYVVLLLFLSWGMFFQIKVYRGNTWNLKADRFSGMGLPDDAVNNLRRATYIDEENDIYRYSLSMRYFSSFLKTRSDDYLWLAKEEMQKAAELNPFSAVYRYQMALIYLNEDPAGLEKEIDKELDKVTDLNPSHIMAYLLKAEQAEIKQDINRAAGIYKQVYEMEQGDRNSEFYSRLSKESENNNPNILEIYNLMYKFYYEKKKLQKSAYFYEKLISCLPERGEAFNNLGVLYLEMKDFKKAEGFFNKAISLEPENVEFHRNLAYTYKINNELDKYDLKMEEIDRIRNKKGEKK